CAGERGADLTACASVATVFRLVKAAPGEVAEWLNAPVSKTGLPARVAGVRISPSPFIPAVNRQRLNRQRLAPKATRRRFSEAVLVLKPVRRGCRQGRAAQWRCTIAVSRLCMLVR